MLIYTLFPAILLLLFGSMLSLWVMLYHKPDQQLERFAVRFGWAALAVYAIWLGALSLTQRQIPILTVGQISAFLGFLIWMDQQLVERRISQRMLVMLPLVLVILLLLAAITGGLRHAEAPQELHSAWSALHIILSMAGVAMLFGSGVYGAGSIILRRLLRNRQFGRLFSTLPSMDDMHRLRTLAVYHGWLLITVSFASSTIFMFIERSGSPSFFSHLHEMFALWVVASLLTLSEKRRWLGDLRQARLTVVLTTLMFLLMVGSVAQIFFGGRS